MKIVFFDANEKDQAGLTELLPQKPELSAAQVVFVPEKLSAQNIGQAKDTEVIGVFVRSPVTKALIQQMPNLKLIVTMSTGFDHIDLKETTARNIAVCNVPGYGSITVAEFTFALILGLSRKAFLAYRQIKDQHDFDISHFEGFNLQGKTLGVAGTGRIGQNVIRIAKGFGMNVLGFDAFPNPKLAEELGFKYASLDELLINSDIVTLHVPYNKDTHHLINKDNIKSFKPGALLINTARGEVADTEAVLYGLKHKILSGAGLDVLEGERKFSDEWALLHEDTNHAAQIKLLLEDHILMDMPEVAITPHIAFFTKEAKKEILQTTVENIASFLQGQPKNLVK